MPEFLVALAAMVVVPLGLRAIDAPDRDGRRDPSKSARLGDRSGEPMDLPMRIARVLLVPAALSLAACMFLPRGTLAGALAVPWLIVTLAVALAGVRRALARGRLPLEELVIDTGCALLAVAGIWTVAARLGVHLLGFDPTWCALTAAHFHYAGFSLSVLAGLAGRVRPLPRPIAWTLIVGPLLVAAGITFSDRLELVASWALALASLGFAGIQLAGARARDITLPARVALAVSGLSLGGGMLLALAFSLANYLGLAHPTIGEMLAAHAPLNAIGFATCGMIARTLAPRAAHRADPRPILGRTRARGYVGTAFFTGQPSAPGLVDRLERYAHAGLDTSLVDPEVRRFYERTGELTLRVRPRWPAALLPFGRVFVALARRIGNLVLPLPEAGVCTVVSALSELPDEGARLHARGSARSYADGSPMYVASYAVHAHYMNIALPLPFACLTSVLRVDALGEHGAITLTSIAAESAPGDEGLYLSTPLGDFSLPLSEELALHPRAHAPSTPDFADAATTLVARHVFRLFGIRCLELEYAIAPTPAIVAP